LDEDRLVDAICEAEPSAATKPADEDHTIFWLILADQFRVPGRNQMQQWRESWRSGRGSGMPSSLRRPCPGQAGKSQAQYLVRALGGFSATPAPESGDKLTRFGPFSSQCRVGNVKIRRGAWNEELFRVLESFPDLAHDDEVDACSGALEMLNPRMKSWGSTEFKCPMYSD
jgi:predicted phage terminase large subunit-like protein